MGWYNGLDTIVSRKGKRLVYLGANGYGCKRELVFLEKKEELHPIVDDKGMIYLAYPAKRDFYEKVKGNIKKTQKVILKKAIPSQTKALVRINTSTPSAFRVNGRWQELGGWPTVWVRANGFQCGQSWVDDLVVMDDQDVILVVPAGGCRTDRRVIYNLRGEMGCIPEIGYRDVLKEIRDRQNSLVFHQDLESRTGKIDVNPVETTRSRCSESSEPSKEDTGTPVDSEDAGEKKGEQLDTVIHENLSSSTSKEV